jgi:N-acetylglucosaminyldiphosphoundecaprenol N-acetyl-beta-D-mannosaminyltransferase
MARKRIIDCNISVGSFDETRHQIVAMAKRGIGQYVCIANVHMTVEAHRDKAFRQIVNASAIATPDGKPLAIGMKLLYGIAQERVSGPDLMPVLFADAEREGIGVYFFGSTPEVLDTMRRRIEQEHPKLKICGMVSPPFRALSPDEESVMVREIAESGAGIVFVALGCPKQEAWMHTHHKQIPAVLIGVGAAFPFYAGLIERAPEWMQRWCLEWLYRLLMEPKRLFKRYFDTNTTFLWLFARQWIRLKLGKTNNSGDEP